MGMGDGGWGIGKGSGGEVRLVGFFTLAVFAILVGGVSGEWVM